MIKKITLLLILTGSVLLSKSQITITPENPTVNDTITLLFDATQGNAALTGISPVYIHTGVLTTESVGWWDWKFVKTNWGENTDEVLMEDVGNNKHRLRFHVRTYYGIPDHVTVTDLVMVFRNSDGSVVGRSAEGIDIVYPIASTSANDNYVSHQFSGNHLTISTQNSNFSIQAFTDDIVRVGIFIDSVNEGYVSKVVEMQPSANATLTEDDTKLVYSTAAVTLSISKNPVRFTWVYHGDTVLRDRNGLYHQGNATYATFTVSSDEAFHGTGLRAVAPNLRGRHLQMYNQPQYGYGLGAENLNIGIPFVVSSKNYGIYFDHIYPGEVKLGQTANTLWYKANNRGMSYFFIGSRNPEELLANYTTLTGKAPLPPRWALGYIQSKFGYETETEARNIVNQLRNENFPLDALVLDLYWFGNTSTMGNLTWDYTRFPDPVGMMNDFRNMGVKTILITEPYVTTSSSNYQTIVNAGFVATNADNNPFVINDFWAGPSALLTLTDTQTQNWMWNFYKNRIDEGVAGWWCDLGEPENHPSGMFHHGKPAAEVHNYFSWEWAKMLKTKYEQEYPQQRLFNLIRSGYAGMQRHGAIPWSGDIQRSWDGMKIQVPIMLNMGYSGVGYMHSDLGGFTGGNQDGELYTRWLQLGAFSPVMRAHGVDIPTEPVFYPENYKNIVRSFIQLRYRLLPYNYTLAWENSTTGIPLARAMDFYDIANTDFHNCGDQYFWGENLLVAPVLEPNANSRTVQLPEGRWVNYFTGETHAGDRIINVDAPINTMPLFVRSGSFIPHTNLVASTDDYHAQNLSVWYYPDSENPETSYTLFNDNGQDPASLTSGQFELISFDGNFHTDSTIISVNHSGSFPSMPVNRVLEFRVKNILTPPTHVYLNRTLVPVFQNQQQYDATFPAAFYSGSENEFLVHMDWNNTDLEIAFVSLVPLGVPTLENKNLSLVVYPTVVNQNATIEFFLKESGYCRIEVLNSFGQTLKTLHSGHLRHGRHILSLGQIPMLASGIYLVRLSTPRQAAVARFVVVR